MPGDHFLTGVVGSDPEPVRYRSGEEQWEVTLTVPLAVSPHDTSRDVLAKLLQAVGGATTIQYGATALDNGKTLSGVGVAPGSTLRVVPGDLARPEVDDARDRMDELIERHLTSLKESLGPKYIAKEETRVQVRERSELIDGVQRRLDSGDLPLNRFGTENFLSRLRYDLNELKISLAQQEVEFDRALLEYHAEKRRAVRLTAVSTHRKSEQYLQCLEDQDPKLLNILNREVELLANARLLQMGEVVRVVNDGAFIKAQVASSWSGTDNGQRVNNNVPLLLEFEELRTQFPYSKAFTMPCSVPRSEIYAEVANARQPDPGPTAQLLATERGRDPATDPVVSSDVEYLAELMTKAEALRPFFQSRVAHWLAKCEVFPVELIPGALKRPERIAQKAAEKYRGCYAEVLDLVRLTIVCGDLVDVRAAFKAIATMPGTRLVRAKNRLHPAFDAAQSAGYRDLMLNVVDIKTGIVCEVQITLRGFMAAKMSGGHAMYKILRLVGRLEPASSEYQGNADDEGNIARLADGLFSSWDGSGSHLTPECVATQLVPALSSERCFLQKLVISAVAGLESLADTILTERVLGQLAPSLEILQATHCTAAGPVPVGLRQCTRLTTLRLEFNKLEGHIPKWLGELPKLAILHLGNNCLRGAIPPELFQQGQLRSLFLYENKLKKGVPAEIGRCTQLTKIDVGHNGYLHKLPADLGLLKELKLFLAYKIGLKGAVPESIRDLRKLTVLSLSSNALIGPIPPWLGELTQLRQLRLNHNTLSGSIPVELGDLVNLTILKLNNNELTGVIPEALTKLKKLETLGLRGNSFEGDVPSQLRVQCKTLD